MIKLTKTVILIAFTNNINAQCNDYLKYIKEFEISDTQSWVVSNCYLTPFFPQYNIDFELKTKDTSKMLRVCFDTIVKKNLLEEMYLYHYDSLYYYITLLASTYDTCYIKKFPLNNIKETTFIVGKYEYMYSHLKLTEGQRIYYENFRDSLKRIRGDDLPPLPDVIHNEILYIFEKTK